MPNLHWVAKNKVITHHQDVPYRILNPKYFYDEQGESQSLNHTSENMIIQGDNLDALKSLLPEYEGKIDFIYIDPPYNTGKEQWRYNDNVNDPHIKKWLGRVVGEESTDLTRHDKWLTMMYPRLRLLHRLLAPTGSILVSVDDNEQASLKLIMDEIFGRNNFLSTFIWESTGNSDNQGSIRIIHEYIHAYAKNSNLVHINNVIDPNIPADSKVRKPYAQNTIVKNGPKNPASTITLPIGFPCEVNTLSLKKHDFAADFFKKMGSKKYIEPSLKNQFPITYPLRLDDLVVENDKLKTECRVFSGWSSNQKLKDFIDNGCNPILLPDGASLYFYLTKSGAIYSRKNDREGSRILSILRGLGTTQSMKKLLETMELTFQYPKPYELISYLISIFCPENALVLDSFAGSGTTAHSVLDGNRNSGRHDRFILVELGEYANELTAQRIKNVISGWEYDKFTGKGINRKKEHFSAPGIGGDFVYYELGEPILLNGELNSNIPTRTIYEYIWFQETSQPLDSSNQNVYPHYLGTHNHTSFFFVYDKNKITSLDRDLLAEIPIECGADSYLFYADLCTLSATELRALNITFKKIPRDISTL